MNETDEMSDQFCKGCGVSFKEHSFCGYIASVEERKSADFSFRFYGACSICFLIDKIEADLRLLKVFVKKRTKKQD